MNFLFLNLLFFIIAPGQTRQNSNFFLQKKVEFRKKISFSIANFYIFIDYLFFFFVAKFIIKCHNIFSFTVGSTRWHSIIFAKPFVPTCFLTTVLIYIFSVHLFFFSSSFLILYSYLLIIFTIRWSSTHLKCYEIIDTFFKNSETRLRSCNTPATFWFWITIKQLNHPKTSPRAGNLSVATKTRIPQAHDAARQLHYVQAQLLAAVLSRAGEAYPAEKCRESAEQGLRLRGLHHVQPELLRRRRWQAQSDHAQREWDIRSMSSCSRYGQSGNFGSDLVVLG